MINKAPYSTLQSVTLSIVSARESSPCLWQADSSTAYHTAGCFASRSVGRADTGGVRHQTLPSSAAPPTSTQHRGVVRLYIMRYMTSPSNTYYNTSRQVQEGDTQLYIII